MMHGQKNIKLRRACSNVLLLTPYSKAVSLVFLTDLLKKILG